MRIVIGAAALLLASATAQAAPFHHPYGEWREYHRDWLAACPDTIDEDGTDFYSYSCFASTGSVEVNSANLPAYKLTLIRNRLNGELDLAITVATDAGEYDPARPMILHFAGDPPLSLMMGRDIETRFNTVNQFFIVDDAAETALIDKMKERVAVTLAVPIKGQEKSVVARLSMQGVLASLDFMDTYARKVKDY